MYRLRAYRAECCTTITNDKPRPNHPTVVYYLSALTASKPNKMRYDHWEPQSDPITNGWKRPAQAPKNTFVSDGKTYWQQLGSTYHQEEGVTPRDLMTADLEPWGGFYNTNESLYRMVTDARSKGKLREMRIVGQETVEGVLCDKISIVLSEYFGEHTEDKETWYLGPDYVMRRCVRHHSYGGEYPGYTRDAVLHHIQTNLPLSPHIYAYIPPSGVTPEQPTQDLLPNGTMAPNFTRLDAQKNPVKLSDYRGKVVVIDFWASWCAPCMASMPRNQEVIKKLQEGNLPVALLAVDSSEDRDAFDAWFKQKGATYSALNFVHCLPSQDVSGTLFRVTSIPTQYVVDQAGVIHASFVGFDKSGDSLEKAIRACLPTSSR